MRIHYLLFSFLLVLLSPLSAFSKKVYNAVSCMTNGGICWLKCSGTFREIGSCGTRQLKCCKKK
uniref:Beta-defensin 3 n=1 Tax=Rattus norvegicus TaxID=10116 RepID=DEFB3_RAT|nr:beta-defensin 3 precursor [Rattus norvegicus]Q32ZI4.1 RecName: Full=Beta-defensin 3; Short=BD-3; AltName: Full=Defensin, beta 3; Flags: Precursor [Rattus norvegicus]AAT51878.1 beta-defensin 3 [Rattus norvegicus]